MRVARLAVARRNVAKTVAVVVRRVAVVRVVALLWLVMEGHLLHVVAPRPLARLLASLVVLPPLLAVVELPKPNWLSEDMALHRLATLFRLRPRDVFCPLVFDAVTPAVVASARPLSFLITRTLVVTGRRLGQPIAGVFGNVAVRRAVYL